MRTHEFQHYDSFSTFFDGFFLRVDWNRDETKWNKTNQVKVDSSHEGAEVLSLQFNSSTFNYLLFKRYNYLQVTNHFVVKMLWNDFALNTLQRILAEHFWNADKSEKSGKCQICCFLTWVSNTFGQKFRITFLRQFLSIVNLFGNSQIQEFFRTDFFWTDFLERIFLSGSF